MREKIASAIAVILLAVWPRHSLAETLGTCDFNNSPDARIALVEQKGKATVTVQLGPGRRQQLIHVDYDDETYSARLDNEGVARVSFALVAPSNTLKVLSSEFAAVECKIDFPEITQSYRIILRWRDPVRVDLHVIEPFRTWELGAYGHIYRDQANTNHDHGLGELDIVSDPLAAGDTGEQSYVVDEDKRPRPGVFGVRRDYVSRGEAPTGAYCDDGPLADIDLTLITVEQGRVKRKNYRTGVSPCNQPIPLGVRYSKLN